MKKFTSLLLLLVFLSLPPQLAHAYDEWDILAQTSTGSAAIHDFRVNEYGDVTAGRVVDHNMTATQPDGKILSQPNVTPDFFWSAQVRQLFARSVILEEAEDPVDIAMRRHNGTYPNGDRQPVPPNTNIGSIFWQPWDGTSYYILNKNGDEAQGRIAEISARSATTPSQTDRSGYMDFSTGRVGELTARPALRLTERGTLMFFEKGDSKNNAIYWVDDPDTGVYKKKEDIFAFASHGDEVLRIGRLEGTNTTGIWLGVNRDGVRDVVQVEVGASDSGGTGYRGLRIKN